MREHKYRGKRVDTGKWVYGDLIRDSNRIPHICVMGCVIPKRVDPETVGEYTGLTLSDGTDIYEGDVLRLYGEEPYDNGVVGMDYNWEFFGTVVFQDGSFVVQEFRDKCCIWIDAIFCEDIDVEKLGNIHDNPELLEV